jgi:hypothetical protein
MGHRIEVDGVDGIGFPVVVSIAKRSRVGDHQGGIPMVPEGAVVRVFDTPELLLRGKYGNLHTIMPMHAACRRPCEAMGFQVADDGDKTSGFRVKPAHDPEGIALVPIIRKACQFY